MRSSLRCAGMTALLAVGVLAGSAAAADPVLAVIVHPAADTGTIDADALALIYKRRKLYWRDGARIQPVNLPADQPPRRSFSRAVLHQSPEAMDDYWNEQYFHGVLPPHVLASESAVLRFVGSTAHAIGYLGHCAVDASVRVLLMIDGDGRVLPAEAPMPPCPPPGQPPK